MIDISFVIPAYNEEALIGETIRAIHDFTPDSLQFEIIVVDNGSIDKTRSIATSCSAHVIRMPSGTIAQLRNFGARSSKGSTIVFLDADVRLTASWKDNIEGTIKKLEIDSNCISGSWVGISTTPSWLEIFWFKPLLDTNHNHMNSGHMIIRRDLFERLGGFDENLETGEDYDISRRAIELGARVQQIPSLKVSHEGYPNTLTSFVRREAWHGKSDFLSLKMFTTSKVAWLTCVFVTLHITFFVCLVSGKTICNLLAASLILGICLLASIMKFRAAGLPTVIINVATFYAYFLGRAGSILLAVSTPRAKHRKRGDDK